MVSEQLKAYLHGNSLLSCYQSGFRKAHSTVTAATKVVNDITGALDRKQHCASLFIDFSKAFDTVDHDVLRLRLGSVGLSNAAVGWFSNYLSNRTQCVKSDGCTSNVLSVCKGVPQGSVLAPLLFTIYINDLGKDVCNANLHFYADDTVIYCCARSISQAVDYLQIAFKHIETQFLQLRLVLNAGKTKMMIFSKSNSEIHPLPVVTTAQGDIIEIVPSFTYLGITLDKDLNFKPHIENLSKKLKVRLGFYFRNLACFPSHTRKRLVAATFLPVLDYGDVVYMHGCATSLGMLDATYHGALRFITGCKSLTHRDTLYDKVGWPSLSTRRLHHWYIFIYKALIGLLPPYLSSYLTITSNPRYNLRSEDFLNASVPRARTEYGKSAFAYSAPKTWNQLQTTVKLTTLVSLRRFKLLISNLVT